MRLSEDHCSNCLWNEKNRTNATYGNSRSHFVAIGSHPPRCQLTENTKRPVYQFHSRRDRHYGIAKKPLSLLLPRHSATHPQQGDTQYQAPRSSQKRRTTARKRLSQLILKWV